MTAKEQGLPELPHPTFITEDDNLYTADQMRAYALAALASDTGERGVGLPESLVALARRCLHIAFVWNDHNFPPAWEMAKAEAKRWGIGSMDDANSWLDAPEEWPVPASLRAQPAGGGDTVHCPWNDEEGSAPPAFPAYRGKSPAPPHWALPAVENALNLLDHYGYIHTDLAAVRDWLKESTP